MVKRQGEEMRDIEPVSRRPTIGSITDIAGHAFFTGDVDQSDHEAVISVAMTRWGESHRGGSNALLRQVDRELGRTQPGDGPSTHGQHRSIGTDAVVLGRQLAKRKAKHARGNEERAVRSGQDITEGLDDLTISVGSAGEVARESRLVVEGQVNDAVGALCTGAKAVEIMQRTPMDFGSGRDERGSRRIGASEPDDLMAVGNEFGHDGRADPTRCTGDEYTHETTSTIRQPMAELPGLMSVTVITVPSMSVTVITHYDDAMTRWQPDSRGRLEQAAHALFTERGFENTTVAEIAELAGVTERTFFRHFSDKREVLFSGAALLKEALVNGVANAPATASPIEAVVLAFEGTGDFFDGRREAARSRQAVIDSNLELQERELIKLASLAVAIADALRQRGVTDPVATLAAEAGSAVFKTAFANWIRQPNGPNLSQVIRNSLEELRTITADT